MATTKSPILTKDGLITRISDITGEKKNTCAAIVDAYPQVIQQTLLDNLPKAGEISKISLPNIGTLGVKVVPATKRMNNFTKKEQVIPEHYGITFKVTKSLKVALNADLLQAASKGGKKKSA